jgi:hypothetical protein
MAGAIAAMIEQGTIAMKRTLELAAKDDQRDDQR